MNTLMDIAPAARITRILMLSPKSSELFKRNRSYIFIAQEGESVIDSMIFQSGRDIEAFTATARRAINMAGLTAVDDRIMPVYGEDIGEFGGSRLQTAGWLMDEQKNVYDLFIQIEKINTDDIVNQHVKIVQAVAGDNGELPLIMSVDVDSFMSDETDMDDSTEIVARPEDEKLAARQSQEDDDRQPGARGRVKDPTTDRRLRQNRDGGAARKPQDNDDENKTEARRGRVRSQFDMRLRGNRAGRRPQDGDDTPTGGGSSNGGRGEARRSGGRAKADNSGSGSNAPRADLTASAPGDTASTSITQLSGNARRRPGPQVGLGLMRRLAIAS